MITADTRADMYPLALRRAWLVEDMKWQLEKLSDFGLECDKAAATELSDRQHEASKFLRLAIAALEPDGVPTYCESCWHDLPKKRKKNTNVWWDDPARNKGGD